MIRFNLEPGKYKVSSSLTWEGFFFSLFVIFFAPFVIMLAYGAVIEKFSIDLPMLGYLDILLIWVALHMVLQLFVEIWDRTIEIKRLD